MGTILITGANGFVGRHLAARLTAAGYALRLTVRRPLAVDDVLYKLGEVIDCGNVDSMTDWLPAVRGVSAVVHLANRAHVMYEMADEQAALYQHVNVDGTLRLAEQSAEAGVKRLIYLSSVKVLGESTGESGVFDDAVLPNPQNSYAVSKREAEQLLINIASTTAMNVTILRPPLVYGPGVGANFLRLMNWIACGIPLPLSAVDNRRSMIYVGNLADGIRVCLDETRAAGRFYLISDGTPVSTASLVEQLSNALQVADRSWPLPTAILRSLAGALGQGEGVRRLTDSLVVDDRLLRQDLNWQPPISREEGLQHTAKWFRTLR